MMTVTSLVEDCIAFLVSVEVAERHLLEPGVVGKPTNPASLYKLGILCRRYGDLDLWRSVAEAALALPHDTHEQIYLRGNAKLLLGDPSGWVDLEARIYDPSAGYLDTDAVRHMRYETLGWDGREDIIDKTLLIIADGSLGDCLQMLRYIPSVSRLARRVILSVRPEAVSLVRHILGNTVTVTLRTVVPTLPYDRYVWMLSLPALVPTTPPLLEMPIRSHVGVTTAYAATAVGLCVIGDHSDLRAFDRSIDCRALAQAREASDYQWFCLQLTSPASPLGLHQIIPLAQRPMLTLMDVVTAISELDLVITVDTAIAHLAGMLRRPTYVLLSTDADPRWGLGHTTPWYPSWRLMRQRTPGEWDDVLSTVIDEMDRLSETLDTVHVQRNAERPI
jgi:hypothetical protein